MEYTANTYNSTPEIFKRKTDGDYTKEVTLDTTAFTNGVCKAGSPISAAGKVVNAASGDDDPVGILIHDVYSANPNGTVCYHGILNLANCESNSGLTIAAAVKTKLPLVVFE